MRERRGPKELRELGIKGGEDVEEREKCLGVVELERLQILCCQLYGARGKMKGIDNYHVWNGEVSVRRVRHA